MEDHIHDSYIHLFDIKTFDSVGLKRWSGGRDTKHGSHDPFIVNNFKDFYLGHDRRVGTYRWLCLTYSDQVYFESLWVRVKSVYISRLCLDGTSHYFD